jgi:hypothetical protein
MYIIWGRTYCLIHGQEVMKREIMERRKVWIMLCGKTNEYLTPPKEECYAKILSIGLLSSIT